MTKDSVSNYRTKVKGYKNASSPVNRVCGRIPPESATDSRVCTCIISYRRALSGGRCRGYRQWLRSSSSSSLIVSRTRQSTVGDRAFPVAAARVWNSLPDLVTSAPSVAVFRSRLKPHLFNISYPSPFWLYSARAVTLSCFGPLDTIIVLPYLWSYCSNMLMWWREWQTWKEQQQQQ